MPAEEEAKLFEEMMTHQEAVFRICLGFSRNPSDAEDLSQDVYLKAFRSIGRIHSPYAVKEWLYRVARTTCLDHHKKRRVARLFLHRVPDAADGLEWTTPEVSADTNERLNILKKAVGRLPKKQREIFVLREYGHLSYQELARTLGAKAGTIMSRLNRARRAVMKIMGEELHGHRNE
ncbi:MAG TPA: RNA polymerase sigma factor [Candidatus Latescibacteria bacterium]|nr:RNA polymerase sigma factor [Candidatus Latescibacterota bacterium]